MIQKKTFKYLYRYSRDKVYALLTIICLFIYLFIQCLYRLSNDEDYISQMQWVVYLFHVFVTCCSFRF